MENREFYIEHDGRNLHAKIDFPAEQKETYSLVILEHGYTGHMEEPHIRGIARALTENGFAVMRVELYGHGKSSGSFGGHSVLKWVDEMLTVIDYALKLDFARPLYLAGHSQGGLTAMLAAALRRDVIQALILLAPATMIRDQARRGCSFGIEYDPEHIPNELNMGEGRLLGGDFFRTAQLLPIEDAIDAYKGPVLIVHSDTDETVPIDCSREAANRYSNARVVIPLGDDHCFHQKLDEVIDAMVEFLKQI